MSTISRSIVSIIDPKIKVDQITQQDTESKEARDEAAETIDPAVNTKNTSRWGAYMPLIMVNSSRFDQDQITNMALDLTNHIPTLDLALNDSEGKLALDAPTDGDVISLYLKPPDEDNQKPIRIDFDIMDISGSPATQSYSFRGIMKIPGFLAERCKSFPKGNSFDHLQTMCEDIKLGFASNETSTDDSMTRICAFDTYEHFVKDTMCNAYKDDDSFFTWYIDPYYYLCMVNVNKQFDLEDKTETVNISMASPASGGYNQQDVKDSIKGTLVLTNRADRTGTNVFIENWAPNNNSAAVWIKNGYKRYSQYLDIDSAGKPEYVSTFVDPLTTPGSETESILPKGRKGDDSYKSQVKYKWLGKQSADNVHPSYIFSGLLNFQNLQEINKTSIDVELAGMNFYLYRYMRIPILIYEGSAKDPTRMEKMKDRDTALGEDGGYDKAPDPSADATGGRSSESGSGDADPTTKEKSGTDPRDQIKNEHISGYYVINTIKYTYSSPGPVKMKLNLIRREWNIPSKNKNY
jgi:hypothetical protein